MTGSRIPRCPNCGEALVLEMDPPTPPDSQASMLLADPPFRYVCDATNCSSRGMTTPP